VTRDEIRRPVTERERALIDRLVSAEFPGCVEIREQLRSVTVRDLDPEGSLELLTTTGPDAPVDRRVPVEAEVVDRDGKRIHVMLHVIDGRAKEIEIYKDDGSAMLEQVDASKLQISP
jgi:hypothetical protein